MNQESLREKLNQILEAGLTSKAVVKKTGIPSDILSRFKNGYVCLCARDAATLESYLDKVVIP